MIQTRLRVEALFLLGALFATPITQAQLTQSPSSPILGARMPALSPDGKQMVFVYRGDLWSVSSKGGNAFPLTQHVDLDAYPLFSPDGQWVAFSSKRNGNWDIFAVAAGGGEVKQMTWHAGTDIPFGWSPDGKEILFSTKRDTPDHTLYALEVDTLQTRKLAQDYASMNYPNFSPDGKSVVYGRNGFHWSRPRYQGSAAAEIWTLSTETGERKQLTSTSFQHLWSRFLPSGESILTVTVGDLTPSVSKLDEVIPKFVDSPLLTPNLWVYDLVGKGKQLTHFTGGGVRFPSVAWKSGDIAFEYEHEIYVLRSGKKNPTKVPLLVAMDEKQSSRRREKLTSGTGESEPSPDGKLMAFELRGDIWTVAVEKAKGVAGRGAEFARRLTDWAGDDSDFVWSHDGKKLYFTSDREFNSRLFEMDIETLAVKSLWNRTEDVVHPRLSPDGKLIGFLVTGKEGGIYTLDIATGESRRVVHMPGSQWRGSGGGDFSWSPDMKWIAFTRRSYINAWNIWIAPAAGGDAVNVTRLNAFHGQPVWSPDGKYLFFQSNRDGQGLFVLPLTRESIRTADIDLKYEKPKEAVNVEIEFENISSRIRRLSSQGPQGSLIVTIEGTILFLSDGDVWSVTYDGKETKKITSGGGKSQFRVLADGKRGFYIQGGELYLLKLDSGNGTEKITFQADWERDMRAERRAAFTQFWRSYHRGFYDPNLHARNWEAIRQRYEVALPAVDTSDEFATLLTMMVGELEASHSEVTPAADNATAVVTPHLGFTFDYTHTGPGLRVADVPPNSPGSYRQTEVKPGQYIMAINGRDVVLGENLYQWINDKQERDFEFLINDHPSREGAKSVKYKVLTQEEWTDINYRNRTQRLRGYVEEKSEGKVGYLHLTAMGMGQQIQFEREAYEYILGKEAIIIDVRFNAGGNISDTLIDWLERKPHGFNRARDGRVEPAPYYAWEKPIIVLMNEASFSNSEMFPYAMRQKGLAKLVGMPTPGYVIWTDGLRLVDGTNARMPQTGVYRLNGTTQENDGEVPDVKVPLTPQDWNAQRDPQIDKAIEMLLIPGKEPGVTEAPKSPSGTTAGAGSP